MTPTPRPQIELLVRNQHHFFNSGKTLGHDARKDSLERLRSAIKTREGAIHRALKQDLGKPEFEAYGTETGISIHDITQTLKHLKRWMRPKRVPTSILVQPGKSRVLYTPLGVNLIIAPYNYPFQLAMAPLTAAIAAGNTVVLKPSEMTPNVSDIICKIIGETFDPSLVAAVPGEVEQTTALLSQKFDHIFFTGSTRVGSIVMQAAARHLTPVTLELGGKSPCIVHHDANLDIAVRRIVRGKFINAGQTCVAPDYLLVHKSIKKAFLTKLTSRILDCFGKDASESPDYGRIVNHAHLKRIMALIDPTKVVVGGKALEAERFIAPTVMDNVTLDDPVMKEEIFGPVLPVIEYENLDDIYRTVEALPQHPLALYLFSGSKSVQEALTSTIRFGGGCINNSLMHLANPYLPFGGVGESGIGAYHGFAGFERFSHKKSILKSDTWIDLPLFYPPYKNKLSFLRKIMG
ncbi:MAG: aldehyde dehydrogenase [Desulfobacteraceae bacterium]|nr:aldehyde dehydrogenase [Desulfobacteraceae bacterium]